MIRIARRLRVNQTDAETALWNRIRNRQIDGHKFVRQQPIGGYVCGFFCRGRFFVIEVDGGQHNESAADAIRDRRLAEEGLQSTSILEQRCSWQSRRRSCHNPDRTLRIEPLTPLPLPAKGGERERAACVAPAREALS